MKFEQVINLIKILIWKFNFKLVFLLSFFIKFFNKFFFSWKILNYADSYWFLYSNKKFFYEKKNIL